MRSRSRREKRNGKVTSPILPHTNFSFRAGQINQLILLVDTPFLGMGWMEYDRVFRRQLAINQSLSWNTLEPGLQAATILGQARSQGTFCSLCRECDHDTTQCALAPLQQQVRSTPVTLQTPVGSRPPRRPESLQHICVNWNKGICRRLPCTYRHICATCQLSHRARDCPDTPADSVYKAFTTNPTPLFSGRPSTARSLTDQSPPLRTYMTI